MKLRWWLERSAIVAGVVATMATSQPRWHLTATIPANDRATARVLSVEASQDVVVTVRAGTGPTRSVAALAPVTWPGTARFLIPPDHEITQVEIGNRCSAGCFKKCRPEEDSFVRVTAIAPAHSWRLEARSEEIATTIVNPVTKYSRFPLTATHPVRLELEGTGWGHAIVQPGHAEVSWRWSEQRRTERWTLRAISDGLCPGDAPCDPPADAKLELGKEEIIAIPQP